MEPLVYREAVPEDKEALVEIWWSMQSAHSEYDPRWYANKGEETCKALWGEHVGQLILDAECTVAVATSAGNPIGFLLARVNVRPPVYEVDRVLSIDSTAVHPDFRGRGVFRGMLSLLEARACETGIKVIELRVQEGNPARRAYERTGFEPETLGMIRWIE